MSIHSFRDAEMGLPEPGAEAEGPKSSIETHTPHDYDDQPLGPEYEHGHISSVQIKEPSLSLQRPQADDPRFFHEIVEACQKTTNLPMVYPDRFTYGRVKDLGSSYSLESTEDTAAKLYEIPGLEDDTLRQDNLAGLTGQVLSIRKLIEMHHIYIRAQLQREYKEILQQGTTTDEQMGRVQKLLRVWSSEISNFEKALEDEEESLLQHRIQLYKHLHPPNTESSVVEFEPAPPSRRATQFTQAIEAVEKSSPFHQVEALMRYLKVDSADWKQGTMDSYLNYVRDRRRAEMFERKRIGYSRRFMAAFVGGVLLVVPVIIMALGPNLNKSLITTSVAVIVFSLYMSWANSTLKQGELLAASAAYAAVLVVFVGVSIENS
ncbi:hypothetical protein F4677DRAFT_435239 [Hypoxylon crocopeplum]|nr:hypothetical protein F4677DRAFT_435239 [Hypoxylon crocopeplum]